MEHRGLFKQLTFWSSRVLLLVACGFIFYFAFQLFSVLGKIPIEKWLGLIRHTLYTTARVLGALTLSTLWAVPVGIWIGTSPKRIRIAQPIIQVLASFPAPMLYPLALTVFFTLGISFHFGAMFLMLLGVQWYVLFNVLAGALRIPQELNYALSLMETSRWDRWKTLYLPSVFPSLATGWVTAAGGAWNASVVAEYIAYQGSILQTEGLGADLNLATAGGDLHLFAASLTIMVFVVILLNRVLWSRVYQLAQSRFRMDT
jgi:NitT/TauT family transport system permease protein